MTNSSPKLIASICWNAHNMLESEIVIIPNLLISDSKWQINSLFHINLTYQSSKILYNCLYFSGASPHRVRLADRKSEANCLRFQWGLVEKASISSLSKFGVPCMKFHRVSRCFLQLNTRLRE